MAVKKSQIYSSLWASCNALRGGMDASIYKDYILVLLFVKYVSDKYGDDPYAPVIVPKGGSFADMVKLVGSKNIGEGINTIIATLAEQNGLRGIIDNADFDDSDKLGKGDEKVKRLSNLVSIFNRSDLSFKGNQAGGDDILGDAYEYLMRHFATESGKSKGQFYTPAEVSRIMARVIGVHEAKSASQTIYDPTCGSGSLLLRAHHEAPVDLTIYGQEKDVATRGLAVMNMFLHNVPTAEVKAGNTLTEPQFQKAGALDRFDFVVANPPFSDKAWMTGIVPDKDEFERFEHFGIPPKKNGDYAYLLHVVASMKSTGKGCIVMPHGVLFRGNTEATIRKKLIERRYIKGIIGLPANLFFGTGIPACLIVLDKEHTGNRKGIYMIDASKGFVKDGPKNRLRDQDVHKIVDCFTRQLHVPGYAEMVSFERIEAEGYNLNIPRYIDSSSAEDLHDIEAHLRGGIPAADIDALQPYWDVLAETRARLFGDGPRPGTVSPLVSPIEMKAVICDGEDFAAYAQAVHQAFAGWRDAHRPALAGFGVGHSPSALIHALSEDLLGRFAELPLIDGYDVYQHLMSYWDEVMQDDAGILAIDGWDAAKVIRKVERDEDKKFAEEPDIKLGGGKSAIYLKAELIPPSLIVARFFADEAAEIERLEGEVERLEAELAAMVEEHGGEDGDLSEAVDEDGDFDVKAAKVRRAAIVAAFDKGIFKKFEKAEKAGTAIPDRLWSEFVEELPEFLEFFQIDEALRLADAIKDAKADVKAAKAALDGTVVNQYTKLTLDEAKALVIDDKWLARLAAAVEGELARVAQRLSVRCGELAKRYDRNLPDLMQAANDAQARVAAHLAKMGFAL
ncbi:type I restriction-modification system subunit M [Sandarakinorhabdus sp. AAP62]|uniref:type I restriction-modification system subunit M n=1 Tax=Sandarakinorhabdus sp. AAP62 TaxID=1248916 RepID=UPI0002FB5497|nr:type I restriction-modification system subunit M [Sandarakinorhabdus sp. AAP62]